MGHGGPFRRLLAGGGALLFAGAAMAQTFPTKVVRIINAQGPGVLEVVSRGYAQERHAETIADAQAQCDVCLALRRAARRALASAEAQS